MPHRKSTIERVAPEPFGSAIDRANDLDRDWFAKHPNADERVRATVLGEFWPEPVAAGTLVRVVRVAPGLRARIPLMPVGVSS
jgi:hypothetical protein